MSWADYLPYGEVMLDRRSVIPNYTDRHGYQGDYAECDPETATTIGGTTVSTGWNSFDLRMYDANVGRWLSRDPKKQYWSPYVGMGNNPVNLVDPDGGGTHDDIHSYSDRPNEMHVVNTNQNDRYFLNGKLVNPDGGVDGSWNSKANIGNGVKKFTYASTYEMLNKLYGSSNFDASFMDYMQSADDIMVLTSELKLLGSISKSVQFLKLGTAVGRAGNMAGGLSIVVDYNDPTVSTTRFIYNTSGTVIATIIPAILIVAAGVASAPAEVTGVLVGGSFWAGAKSYDATQWWIDEMAKGITNIENNSQWLMK